MLDMLKSRTVIMFIVLVLGVTFLSTSYDVKLEKDNQKMDENYITMNIK